MLITFSPQRYEPIKSQKKSCTAPKAFQPKKQLNNVDTFTFGARQSYEFLVKEISGLPCAYCGKTMLTNKEVKAFGKEINDLVGEDLQNKLSFIRNEDQVPFEQSLAKLLTKQSLENPEKNLQELLIGMFPMAERKLVKSQKRILYTLPKIAKNLVGETREQTFHQLNDINAILDKKKTSLLFKKQVILANFRELIEAETNPENKILLDKMMENLITLPRAIDNKNAFIVKYSRRSSREIGETLMSPFLASADHLEPSSEGGLNKQSNFLCVHKHCNEERNVDKLPQYIENHPEVVGNIKNQIKILAEKIRKYETTFELNNYPNQISKTLKKISNGVVTIDTNDCILHKKDLKGLLKIMQEKVQN